MAVRKGSLVLWSVGVNGRDDGGVGEDNDPMGDADDVVVALPGR